jgi:hypothetical protein
MPKFSGQDIISEATEKTIRRSVLLSAVAVLAKVYVVPLNDLKILGMELPAALFDTVLFILVLYSAYSFIINWVGDLFSFRLWYRESSIWSEFGTHMKLDKRFIRGSIPLLLRLHELEKNRQWPAVFSELDENSKKDYNDFKTNVELYCIRLEHAGTSFLPLQPLVITTSGFKAFFSPSGSA